MLIGRFLFDVFSYTGYGIITRFHYNTNLFTKPTEQIAYEKPHMHHCC